MAIKIVFIGPRNAGKTTLRKIFFEGEEPNQFLINPLEPTQGMENIIFNIGEEIVVFDLAGQQNEQWFDIKDRAIFSQSDIILLTVGIDTFVKNNELEYEELYDNVKHFLTNIVEIQNTLNLNSLVYVLIHKIDLLDDPYEQIEDIYRGLIHSIVEQNLIELIARNLLKIGFTSIIQEYFLNTLVIFLDIMKIGMGAEYLDEFDLNSLRELLETIYKTQDYFKTNDAKFLTLTNEGKNFLKKNFKLLQAEVTTLEYDFQEISPKLEAHPILGFWISIKDSGLFLFKCEAFSGLFNEYIENLSPELLTGFITAVRAGITDGLNINNLLDIEFKATNVKFHILSFGNFSVTLFTLPNIHIIDIKNIITGYFSNLFEREEFQKFQYSVKIFNDLQEEGIEWLGNINKTYYTIKKAKIKLYDIIKKQVQINQEYSKIKLNYKGELQRIKSLREELMKALINQDLKEINKILKESEK